MFRAFAVVTTGFLVACYSSFDEGGPRGPDRPPDVKEGARAADDASAAAPKTPNKGSKAPAAGKRKKKPEQTYAQAWRVICHADQLSGGHQDQVAEWIVKNLKNEKARYWFIALGNAEKKNRLATFMAEARAAGFSDCPTARLLFPAPAPTPAPAPAPTPAPAPAPAPRQTR